MQVDAVLPYKHIRLSLDRIQVYDSEWHLERSTVGIHYMVSKSHFLMNHNTLKFDSLARRQENC